jgi:hypothetical protein
MSPLCYFLILTEFKIICTVKHINSPVEWDINASFQTLAYKLSEITFFNYGLLIGANACAFYRRALNSNLDPNIDYLELGI